jgi:3-deoxy-7-phosphoheptulonate synthase
MIIKFKPEASLDNIKEVEQKLLKLDQVVKQVSVGDDKYLATSGDQRNIQFDKISSLPYVSMLVEDPPAYYFTSKKFKSNPTIVKIGSVEIGNGQPVFIAGPCAIENRQDALETAKAIKEAGADIYRGGVFKPRTTPYNYQGIGHKGLEILAEIRETYGIPVVTEVLDSEDISAVADHCDAIQVGTRNMTNSALLKRLGQTNKPIILKRGFSSKIEELIRAAEFITVYGNPHVILCERGIQTFETYTRYTLDLSAVPAMKELTHLPVIVDPSHGTGRPSLIPIMSKASIAVDADALMLECHIAPERMIKPGDDFQTLRPFELSRLIKQVKTLHAQISAVSA